MYAYNYTYADCLLQLMHKFQADTLWAYSKLQVSQFRVRVSVGVRVSQVSQVRVRVGVRV